jgi:hypothetical protein
MQMAAFFCSIIFVFKVIIYLWSILWLCDCFSCFIFYYFHTVDAHYWAVLDQHSSVWTPSSQYSPRILLLSHPAPLPSHFPPMASYAAAVAGLRSSSSVVASSSALARRTFSALPCGSDGSLFDGSPACPLLSLAPSPISARPLLSPAPPISPAASSS